VGGKSWASTGDMLTTRSLALTTRVPQCRAGRAPPGWTRSSDAGRPDARLTWRKHTRSGMVHRPAEQKLAQRLEARQRAAGESFGRCPQLQTGRESYRRAAGALTWRLTQDVYGESVGAERIPGAGTSSGRPRARYGAAQAQRRRAGPFRQFAASIAQTWIGAFARCDRR